MAVGVALQESPLARTLESSKFHFIEMSQVQSGQFSPVESDGQDEKPANDISILNALKEALGLQSIYAPGVPHRGHANGLVMTHTSGWKIV